MKARFTLLLMVTLLLSCNSLQKMMDNGDYEGAFAYSAAKLKGKKYKDTKYDQAFEKAYGNLQNTSLHQIEVWSRNPTIQNSINILREYQTIQRRQNTVLPLIPLVSKEGYEAQFRIVGFDTEIAKAEDRLCSLYYDEAKSLRAQGSKAENKLLIKDAYFTLGKIAEININYKDVKSLMNEYRELAIINVEVEVKNNLPFMYGDWISQDVKSMSIRSLTNTWYRYQIKTTDTHLTSADYVMVVDINSLEFSPEREFVREYVESKSIAEKSKSYSKKDSIQHETVHYKDIKVNFIETVREKNAHLAGTFRVYDPRKHMVLETFPINVEHQFRGYANAVRGDERALSETNRKKIDHFLEPFPLETEMVAALSKNFTDIIIGKVKSAQI